MARSVTLHHGNCLDVLRTLPSESVDSVVTDPPYGLSNTDPKHVIEALTRWASGERDFVPEGRGFMGKSWDSFVPPPAVWDECFRVLKPGGHLLAFAGSRTFDLMTLSVRFAGFDIRDSIAWLYGSGFPKSMDVSKAIDKRGGRPDLAEEIGTAIKAAREARGWTTGQADRHFCGGSTNWTWFEGRKTGTRPPTPETFARIVAEWPELTPWAEKVAEVEREVTGTDTKARSTSGKSALPIVGGETVYESWDITAPATDAARAWEGWGTALKPAFEPVVVARKPLAGTVAANVLAHGTGALNIDGCRVGEDGGGTRCANHDPEGRCLGHGNAGRSTSGETFHGPEQATPVGRWPANVVLDESQAEVLDEQSGFQKDGVAVNRNKNPEQEKPAEIYGKYKQNAGADVSYGGGGGASRFFYVAKAPKKERPVYWHKSCTCETMKPCEDTSQPRDTGELRSTDANGWSTSGSGSSTTGPYPSDTTSTTETMTSSTTTSRISSSSPSWSTNEFTPDASFEMEPGGSLAVSAEISNPSAPSTGTSAQKDGPSTVGADPATLAGWSETSVCGNCGAPSKREAHATVKPLTLMRWLVRLVTPPGGTVLEPFPGSGTTVEAAVLEDFDCIAAEREAEYIPLIEQRLARNGVTPTIIRPEPEAPAMTWEERRVAAYWCPVYVPAPHPRGHQPGCECVGQLAEILPEVEPA